MNQLALGFSLEALVKGVTSTLLITIGASLVAIILGLIAGLLRVSPLWPLRWIAIVYIEFFRGTSMLVQIYWWFFVLPIFGIFLSPWAVAVFGIGLNCSAYGAELVRAALQGVDRGQYEASIALNYPRLTMMRRIVLPQAVRAMLPAWGNLLIDLLKGTSLVFFVTITDFTAATKFAADATGKYLLFFGVALFGYYIIARAFITPLVRFLERRLSKGFVRETFA
ncbi:ectoine/hydroxyectoine ABC transporter permease subunit EhuC [Rhizobium jaguaris]|uniref:Ectoine/hydroxyectoine ABC transporter permease subunit EhuC n=1 Tax=Rhizobium jaguaris TaxID=1312183 RepID=A0A387G8B6_9HYPH|nr:ectoine/hydroxyectoine ABC transporter permease subunit EhuC [Rhizobium jaguaris]AYG64101.1 ectoine/hydroxyectoine ABC transporter permease subunit EhuC [Rhizobium jaguaris]